MNSFQAEVRQFNGGLPDCNDLYYWWNLDQFQDSNQGNLASVANTSSNHHILERTGERGRGKDREGEEKGNGGGRGGVGMGERDRECGKEY